MQRSVYAEIFGYLVCLLTVVVFFMSVAGIVNSAFRVVNPDAGPHLAMRAMAFPDGGFRVRDRGDFFFRTQGPQTQGVKGGAQDFGPVQIRGQMPVPPKGMNITAMRDEATGNGRFDAARRLVLSIVMLIVAFLVFRRTFAWLNPGATSTHIVPQ